MGIRFFGGDPLAVYELPEEQQVDLLAWYLVSGDGLQRVEAGKVPGVPQMPGPAQNDPEHEKRIKSLMVKGGHGTEEAVGWWFSDA